MRILMSRRISIPPPGWVLTLALSIAGSMAITGCEPADRPTSTAAPTEAIATIQSIVAQPVWVTLGQDAPQPAQPAQEMAYGDRLRTEDQALAEVALINGAVFRIGGNATLTLRPNQLELEEGQMITWAEGALAAPVEIVTPAAIAGIRGTTVFVNIAPDPTVPIEFFAWEGEVAVRLVDGGEEVILTSGEQLFVTPGETDIEVLRQQVQPIDRTTAEQRLQESALINGFGSPLPTRPAIEATVNALE
jgi:hypothetical protein